MEVNSQVELCLKGLTMGGMLGDKGLSLADTCLASTLPLTIVARKQFFTEISVVVQFYPWFKFFFVFFLFSGIAMYDNEFETKEMYYRYKISLNSFL